MRQESPLIDDGQKQHDEFKVRLYYVSVIQRKRGGHGRHNAIIENAFVTLAASLAVVALLVLPGRAGAASIDQIFAYGCPLRENTAY